MAYLPGRRARRFLLGVGALALATLGVAVDAGRRRDDLGRRLAAVRSIGFADLALSSSARWLRHPSQVELAAPFQDGPGVFDTDPAGAVIGPPVARGGSSR